MRLRLARVAVLLAGLFVAPAALAAGVPGGSAMRNRESAQAAAAHLLGLVQLPAGSVRLTREPAGDGRLLRAPTLDEATPNLVDAHAWWTSSATPSAVLTYFDAHLPAGARAFESSSGGIGPGGLLYLSDSFALPSVAGVLTGRFLGVTVASLPDGATGIRSDGEAVWLTPRPAWERIPAAVREVAFTASGAGDDGPVGPVSSPQTLTGKRALGLVTFINDAEIVQPGTYSCPFGISESVGLRFLAADGAALASATESPTGCADVELTVGDRTGPALSDYPSVTDELIALGAVPVCPASQLIASAAAPSPDGAAHARLITFSFENRSDLMCRLTGFPRLVLISAAGRRLPVRLTDQDAALVRAQGIAANSVLDPGQSAQFGAAYTLCRGARVAARAQVALPGVSSRFVLSVGTRTHPFAPCHGDIGVGNIDPDYL